MRALLLLACLAYAAEQGQEQPPAHRITNPKIAAPEISGGHKVGDSKGGRFVGVGDYGSGRSGQPKTMRRVDPQSTAPEAAAGDTGAAGGAFADGGTLEGRAVAAKAAGQGWRPDEGARAPAGGSGAGAGAPPRDFAGDGIQADLGRSFMLDASRMDEAQKQAAAEAAVRESERYLRGGDLQKALDLLDRALVVAPNHAGLWESRAEVLNRGGEFAAAAESAEKSVALDPERPRAYEHLAWALLHTGAPARALEQASRLIELDEHAPVGYALRAFAHELMGAREPLLKDLRKAAKIAPSRFGNHLKNAEAGATLFSPERADNYNLLQGMLLRQEARRAKSALPLSTLLFGLAATAFIILRARRKSAS